MDPEQKVTLDELRERVGDDVIIAHILRHSQSFDTYSRIDKCRNKETAVDLVKNVSLDFDSDEVMACIDRLPEQTGLGIMIHFTMTRSNNERYVEALLNLDIGRDEYEDNEDGFKLLSWQNLISVHVWNWYDAEWEKISLVSIQDDLLREGFVHGRIDFDRLVDFTISNVEELCFYNMDDIVRNIVDVTYSAQASIDMLTHIGLRRAQSDKCVEAIEEIATNRVFNNLFKDLRSYIGYHKAYFSLLIDNPDDRYEPLFKVPQL